MRLSLGIDPGLRGGIAALDPVGTVVGVWPMPVAGGEIHAAGVADLLRSLRCFDAHQDIRDELRDHEERKRRIQAETEGT